MKKHYIVFCAAFLPLTLSGCAVHPLPDDVSPDNTTQIVNKIRCEFKDALQEELIEILKFYRKNGPNETTMQRLLHEKEFDIGDIENSMVDEEVRKIAEPFKDERLGLNFNFTITLANANSADATFAIPFSNGTFSLGINAGTDLTRKNVRTVQVAETWGAVVRQPCDEFTAMHANIVYPITGKIGLAEVVRTYLQLINIGVAKSENVPVHGKVKTLSEKLTFTTRIAGGLKPTLELKPVNDKFKLTKANGNFGTTRTDEHEVTVVLLEPAVPTEDLKVKLADNVVLTVKAPKGKYRAPQKSGSKTPSAKLIGETSPELTEQGNRETLQELNRLQSLQLNRDILESIQ